jgi:hypothetical protein
VEQPKKKQRQRRGEPPPGGRVVVVRGDQLDRELLRTDALANFDVYGYHGISVFAEVGGATFEWIAVNKLARAEILVVFRAGDLIAAGLQLWDTGQAPHYDVVHEDVDELVERLLGCPREVLTNPYWSDPEARR